MSGRLLRVLKSLAVADLSGDSKGFRLNSFVGSDLVVVRGPLCPTCCHEVCVACMVVMSMS